MKIGEPESEAEIDKWFRLELLRDEIEDIVEDLQNRWRTYRIVFGRGHFSYTWEGFKEKSEVRYLFCRLKELVANCPFLEEILLEKNQQDELNKKKTRNLNERK